MKTTLVFVCLAFQALPIGSLGQPVVLRADRMLDVVSGRIVSNATVVVEGDRITGVNVAPPANARVVNLGDMTLMPGLIDAHVHLGISDAYSPLTRFTPLTDSTADATLRQAQSARITLMSGFTTIREVGQVHPSLDLIAVAVGEAGERGWIDAPHIIAAGHALSITGGHIDPAMFMGAAEGMLELDPPRGVADGIDQVLAATRYQIKHGARVIKIAATAGVMSLEGPVGAQQYSESEIRAVVEEAARHGIPVAAHAHGLDGIKAAVRAGVASIEHGSYLDEATAEMMKKQGTYLVPTVALADAMPLDKLPPPVRAKAEQVLPELKKNVRMAISRGVKIALGTDAPFLAHGQNAKELSVLVTLGMTPADAIRAATINASNLLRVQDRGRIETGLLADLIAVPGNPLEDIKVLESVRLVMKSGRIYKQP